MGSFGSNKVPTPSQQPDFTLGSFYSPFGNLTANGNNATYQPLITPDEQSAFESRNQKINSTLNNLPSSFNVNDAFNNPFYSSTYDLMSRPIQQQQSVDQQNLNNNLNAQNQVGSSYAAMQQDLLNRRYDNLYQNAQDTARQNSYNAYQQGFNNNLDLLNNLQGGQNSLMSMFYAPVQYGLNLQQNDTGMANANSNYNQNLYRLGLNQQMFNQGLLGGGFRNMGS